jgi:hypothetical protein
LEPNVDGFIRAEFTNLVFSMEVGDGQQGKDIALRIIEYLGGQRSAAERLSPVMTVHYILALMISRGYL